jgi:hypothetical protein
MNLATLRADFEAAVEALDATKIPSEKIAIIIPSQHIVDLLKQIRALETLVPEHLQ